MTTVKFITQEELLMYKLSSGEVPLVRGWFIKQVTRQGIAIRTKWADRGLYDYSNNAVEEILITDNKMFVGSGNKMLVELDTSYEHKYWFETIKTWQK